MSVRNAVPALEAYFVDTGSYAGASAAALRRYDDTIRDVTVSPTSDGTSYCLESTSGSATVHKRGPASDIEPGGC